MPYQHFTSKDFLQDERFCRWVRSPDPESDAFWQQWLRAHPEQQPEVEEARQFLVWMQQNQQSPSDAQLERMWHTIQQAQTSPADATPARLVPLRRSPVRWMAAASVTVLLSTLCYLFWMNRERTFTTGNGERLSLLLPDSSEVMLNANSELRYPARWTGQRDVYLEGEAYFSVRPLTSDTGRVKLVVHTPKLAVEVLGTRFNVAAREARTRVVLESGKVRLTTPQEVMLMQPGELVDYTDRLVKERIDPRAYTAWTDDELILDNKTIAEIAEILEETYGLQVTIADTSVANLRLSGSLEMDSADAILQALALAYHLDITHRQNQVLIRKQSH
ncbi:ferric-dicitrate binding protein FerR, regulates iron transport through sigma-19 [Catalinimonas alkaloidigena]|uniref:Ferric-dicitrate binding protein FerR, regulates iron transport through sigma-19 n=1 Tax=Catalinimonas alkaloidigena TaxID=1075417 RepID=A0A1G9GDZ0_9BACT|nr:FecR domain-containing protein [Catalinimonas alkaloidigena]SDK98916.1 ferric-dicitrate binding protein FerR, regulates iron transport through sigma-19 [Catalinimonas alkaloidigena]